MFAYKINQFNQNLKDERKIVLRQLFNIFLDDLIIENSDKSKGYYSLFASDLDYHDKKTFLSYLVDINDFEFYTANHFREREVIQEYEDEMQYMIDQRIDDLYYEIQREMSGR